MITLIILNKDNWKLSSITSPEVCSYSMSQRKEPSYAKCIGISSAISCHIFYSKCQINMMGPVSCIKAGGNEYV